MDKLSPQIVLASGMRRLRQRLGRRFHHEGHEKSLSLSLSASGSASLSLSGSDLLPVPAPAANRPAVRMPRSAIHTVTQRSGVDSDPDSDSDLEPTSMVLSICHQDRSCLNMGSERSV